MDKTRIRALVTVTRDVEVDIELNSQFLNPKNLTQQKEIHDKFMKKFFLAEKLVDKDIEVLEIIPMNDIS